MEFVKNTRKLETEERRIYYNKLLATIFSEKGNFRRQPKRTLLLFDSPSEFGIGVDTNGKNTSKFLCR